MRDRFLREAESQATEAVNDLVRSLVEIHIGNLDGAAIFWQEFCCEAVSAIALYDAHRLLRALELPAPDTDDGEVECPHCDGTGHDQRLEQSCSSEAWLCSECGGEGWVPTEKAEVTNEL